MCSRLRSKTQHTGREFNIRSWGSVRVVSMLLNPAYDKETTRSSG
jgi:hypothetical protein